MGGDKLPDGVPSSNNIDDEPMRGFDAPDMATPKFSAAPLSSEPSAASGQHDFRSAATSAPLFDVKDDDEDDEDDDVKLIPAPPGNVVLIILAIVGLLAALAVIVFMNSQPGQPSCSTQPEWNQYNCKV